MFLKTLSFIFLLIFTSELTFSQTKKLPELLQSWKKNQRSYENNPDSNAVNLLNAIAMKYAQKAPDSGIIFAGKALKMAVQCTFPKGEARAFANISKIQYIKGAYNLSLNASLKCLSLSNAHNDIEGLAEAHNGIGLIYLAQDKEVPALKEFKKAEELNTRLKCVKKLSANKFNISLCYSQVNQFKNAIQPLMESLALSKKINDQNMIAMAKNRLGEIYLNLDKFDTSIKYFQSVIDNKIYQTEWENSFAHSGLASCYFNKGRYELALSHGKEGLRLAKKINAKWDIARSLEMLHKTCSAMNDFEQAYAYLVMEKLYSDSLFSEKKENEINGLHLKQQQIENRDLIKRNRIDQQQININRMVIIIIGLIALSLIVIIALVYRNTLQKSKLNKILQKKSDDIKNQKAQIEIQNTELSHLNQTKDQLFSVIGHDLRSPFASMLGTLQLLKSENLTTDERTFLFDKFFDKVTVTATMIDNLLLWANSQQKGIVAKFSRLYLPEAIEQLLDLLNLLAAEKNIKIQHIKEIDAFIYADPDHIRIIFQNIIGNAIKFTKENGCINIFYERTDELVIIHIKDNGVGIPALKLQQLFSVTGKDISTHGTQNEKGIGIGLMLVKRFSEENMAMLRVMSEEGKGTEFIISFRRDES